MPLLGTLMLVAILQQLYEQLGASRYLHMMILPILPFSQLGTSKLENFEDSADHVIRQLQLSII